MLLNCRRGRQHVLLSDVTDTRAADRRGRAAAVQQHTAARLALLLTSAEDAEKSRLACTAWPEQAVEPEAEVRGARR